MASFDSYTASVDMWAATFSPRGWAFCHGQLLPISAYSALFSIIGTTYGGDGRTTFGLPQLQGRTLRGAGQSPGTENYPLGYMAGVESVSLTSAHLPTHNHDATFNEGQSISGSVAIPVKTGLGSGTNSPENNYLGPSGSTNLYYTDHTEGKALAPVEFNLDPSSATIVVGNSGASSPVDVLQPYTVLNFIICLSNIFPSRN